MKLSSTKRETLIKLPGHTESWGINASCFVLFLFFLILTQFLQDTFTASKERLRVFSAPSLQHWHASTGNSCSEIHRSQQSLWSGDRGDELPSATQAAAGVKLLPRLGICHFFLVSPGPFFSELKCILPHTPFFHRYLPLFLSELKIC